MGRTHRPTLAGHSILHFPFVKVLFLKLEIKPPNPDKSRGKTSGLPTVEPKELVHPDSAMKSLLCNKLWQRPVFSFTV